MKYELKEMKIEVTKKCPLACVHCSSDSSEQEFQQISIEKCLDIIKQAISMGLNELSFSGGEPLIWEGIDQAISFAHSNGVTVNVYTSGNVESDVVFQRLKRAGLTRAIFSLYSTIKEEHNAVTRNRLSFDRTIEAIKHAQKNDIITEIHFVALKNSYKRLEDIVRFARSIGVQQVSVLRFVPQGRGVLLDIMSQEENHELATTIRRLKGEGFNIRTGSPYNVLLLNDHPKCMAARDRLIISPTLKIYPCDAFKQIESKEIANTEVLSSLDENTLSDCWEKSPYFNEVRRAIITPPEGTCKTCVLYVKCLGGCLAQKFITNHSLEPARDPACTRN